MIKENLLKDSPDYEEYTVNYEKHKCGDCNNCSKKSTCKGCCKNKSNNGSKIVLIKDI